MQIPNRSVFANSDCSSDGRINLNSTWGFGPKCTVYVSADGLDSLECEIIEVWPTYVRVKKKTPANYVGADLSAYTLALNTRLSQPAQDLTSEVFLDSINPASRVTLELLNAPLELLGTITSAGTATNNHTTAVPFYDVNQALKELVVTVVPSIACTIKVGADNTVAADATSESLQAGEKRTICLGLNQGWISVLGNAGAACDLLVYRNKLG